MLACSLLISCGSNNSENVNTNTQDSTQVAQNDQPLCTFSYNPVSTQVLWTAYKHSGKVGVSGTIESFEVTESNPSQNPLGVLKGASFSISTSPTSINSSDTLRDRKISQFFFGVMTNTDNITGEIKEIEEGNGQGSGILSLKINDIEKDLPMEYTLTGEKVTLSAIVNFEDWDGQDALASLNEKCAAKHTGEDGENKLWPDVNIIVETTLEKECDY